VSRPAHRLPGFVNAHSHAFQRRLRGAVERVNPDNPEDNFWSWREAMYAAAAALDPDSIHAVCLAAYREMVAAGYVAVGEFHYPHHRLDGTPYDPPNAMADAVVAAAADAGIELVLLMTAYERAGAGRPPSEGQRRFCDPSVAAYLSRVEEIAGRCLVGLAPHSVRAVSRPWLEEIARFAEANGLVVHIHANEQRRELEECFAEHGMAPVELLADIGLLGPRTTLVHVTHVSDHELDLVADAGATVCACPTTEANLGDGYLPALRMFERGIPLCIGSDSNTVIDPVLELREMEAIARRSSERRNVLVPPGDDGPTGYLLDAGSRRGAAALGITQPLPEVEIVRDHPVLRDVSERDLEAALIFAADCSALRPTA
jgi:formimidoylglutamate deiminase